ncbi:MAG: hypothetical protein HUJ96_04615 [Marinilabiliaceae bacterium]|nr:hypothetical protein [Marinilabiliaceae bacterium]
MVQRRRKKEVQPTKADEAKREAIRKENAKKSYMILLEPDKYWQFHTNYQMMLYLSCMLASVVDDIENQAPQILYGKAKAVKQAVKAINQLLDFIRKEDILFAQDTSGNDDYCQALNDARNFRIFLERMVIAFHSRMQEATIQMDSTTKLLCTPNDIKTDKHCVVSETLNAHRHEFPEQIITILEKYLDDNKPNQR